MVSPKFNIQKKISFINEVKKTMMVICQEPNKRAHGSQSWNNFSKNISKVVLDYNQRTK